MAGAAGQAVAVPPQEVTQPPPVQTCPAAQAVAQAPQWFWSLLKSTQNAAAPAPQASGVATGQAQAPVWQAWPAGQALPQAPQLFASVGSGAQ